MARSCQGFLARQEKNKQTMIKELFKQFAVYIMERVT